MHGNATQGIQIGPQGSEPWRNLIVSELGRAELAYVSMTGGGSNLTTYFGASLVADGPTALP